MKKVFIFFSNIIIALFLVWIIAIWGDTYVSHYYPYIAVFDMTSESNFDRVSAGLERLAEESDSFLAMQHQEPNEKGDIVFSYTTFGEGKLPKGLLEKPKEEAQNSSLETNYFIFEGDLSLDRFEEELSEAGMGRMYPIHQSSLDVLLSLFSSSFQIIALLICLLSFGAFSLIGQISQLRTAGIRLIAGESRWMIFMRPVSQDLWQLSLAFLLSLTIIGILIFFGNFPMVMLTIIGMGLLLYNLLLLGISLFFAILFAVGIKKLHLMQLIKGQIPVSEMISLMLIAQLLAIIIITFGIGYGLMYFKAERQQEQGDSAWQRENQLVLLSMARGATDIGSNHQERENKQKIWFHLIDQAVSENRGFLVRHQLTERALDSGVGSITNVASSTVWDDYSPNGNVLIVTPEYLTRQHIPVSAEIEDKMNHLSLGEFILLLPEHLRSDAANYQTIFEEDLTVRLSGEGSKQKMTATLSYLDSGQDRFVYNTSPFAYQQFLRDPIIIVLTPKSTGEQASNFWMDGLQEYFLFKHLNDAQDLTLAHGVDNWVADVELGSQLYQAALTRLKREQLKYLAGVIMGILTAILLFVTMNKLYFEEFRRDIFIKRISGLHFLSIHQKYLIAQLFVFLLGFLICLLLGTNPQIAFFVLLLFVALSTGQLYLQMKRENQMTMLILKGA